jgi:hypothetical protein
MENTDNEPHNPSIPSQQFVALIDTHKRIVAITTNKAAGIFQMIPAMLIDSMS